jgi:hypothetical protein
VGDFHLWVHTSRQVLLLPFQTLEFPLESQSTQPVLKTTALWDTGPCSLMEVDPCFRGVYCLHHQNDHSDACGIKKPLKCQSTFDRPQSTIFQEAVMFILAALKT